jgi:hypothetical protein
MSGPVVNVTAISFTVNGEFRCRSQHGQFPVNFAVALLPQQAVDPAERPGTEEPA